MSPRSNEILSAGSPNSQYVCNAAGQDGSKNSTPTHEKYVSQTIAGEDQQPNNCKNYVERRYSRPPDVRGRLSRIGSTCFEAIGIDVKA